MVDKNTPKKKRKPVRRKANKAKANKIADTLIKNDFSQAQTARDLGVTQAAIGDHIKRNPVVKRRLESYLQVLEEAGVNDTVSAKVIADAMVAEKTISVEDDREGSQTKRGPKPYIKITEEDHAIRLKANEQYIKIKRLIGPTEDEKMPEQHLHIHLGDKKSNELIAEIRNQLTTLG